MLNKDSDNQDLNIKEPDDVVELQQDIYSLTFHQFQKSNNSIWHRELMLKSTMTFIMQLSLCFLILNQIMDKDEVDDNKLDVFTGDVYLNATRLLCSTLLHISIMPEIRASLDMMGFSVSNP